MKRKKRDIYERIEGACIDMLERFKTPQSAYLGVKAYKELKDRLVDFVESPAGKKLDKLFKRGPSPKNVPITMETFAGSIDIVLDESLKPNEIRISDQPVNGIIRAKQIMNMDKE